MYELIAQNIKHINQDINNALARANRTDNVLLVGATKTQPKQVIEYLSQNKLLEVVGENRVQELVAKYDINDNLKRHMIGQLQSNKVKQIIDKVELIHSLDRITLATEIDNQAKKHNKIMDCLIEVNVGGEISKGGVLPNKLIEFCQQVEQFDNIKICGLMTVMPIRQNKQTLIDDYKAFYDMFLKAQQIGNNKQNMRLLSCGMTNDYEIAIEYGHSNIVRIGRKIFGERG